jgi:hypothetical protein
LPVKLNNRRQGIPEFTLGGIAVLNKLSRAYHGQDVRAAGLGPPDKGCGVG